MRLDADRPPRYGSAQLTNLSLPNLTLTRIHQPHPFFQRSRHPTATTSQKWPVRAYQGSFMRRYRGETKIVKKIRFVADVRIVIELRLVASW